MIYALRSVIIVYGWRYGRNVYHFCEFDCESGLFDAAAVGAQRLGVGDNEWKVVRSNRGSLEEVDAWARFLLPQLYPYIYIYSFGKQFYQNEL